MQTAADRNLTMATLGFVFSMFSRRFALGAKLDMSQEETCPSAQTQSHLSISGATGP